MKLKTFAGRAAAAGAVLAALVLGLLVRAWSMGAV